MTIKNETLFVAHGVIKGILIKIDVLQLLGIKFAYHCFNADSLANNYSETYIFNHIFNVFLE